MIKAFASTRLLLSIACALCVVSTIALAQFPDTFSNLQVFPKDIGKDELVDAMRGFAGDLGVRCTYCHVGEEGKPFTEFDFASDQKEPKRIARVMMRMRDTINAQFLATLRGSKDLAATVACQTCHHGLPVPHRLDEILTATARTYGIDSAFSMYRSLRAQYFGRGSYDFGELTLQKVATELDRHDGRSADAIAMLKFNLTFFTESGITHASLGNLYARAGDKEQALQHYRTAFDLLKDPRIKRKIDELLRQ